MVSSRKVLHPVSPDTNLLTPPLESENVDMNTQAESTWLVSDENQSLKTEMNHP